MAGRTRGQGRAATFGLLFLPPELQGAVLKHLDSLEDKLNCARTCRCGSRCSLSFSGSGSAGGGAGWSPYLQVRAAAHPAHLLLRPHAMPSCRQLYQLSLQQGACPEELRLELQQDRWTGLMEPAAVVRSRIHSLR